MSKYVMDFGEIDGTTLPLVGGKGANLGELARLPGIAVPTGFCVTTLAYQQITKDNAVLDGYLDALAACKPEDRTGIAEICTQIREQIKKTPIPQEIAAEIIDALKETGELDAYAVRSSATAEDLPTASFAGQQDTYLNIRGSESILAHIRLCWASLYTDRAATYRLQNQYNQRNVQLSVVVQKMVFSEASGILFTADAVTGNRNVLTIDAGFGLGEALVSGLVDPDIYKVRDNTIIERNIPAKKVLIHADQTGGTSQQEITPAEQKNQVLTEKQILQLAAIGKQIEAHFGKPQDIEWCVADGQISIVQSRPITTLFPAPEKRDGKPRVYLSMSHQQMMTDAIKPLGIDIFHIGFDMSGGATLIGVGGRIYMDVSHDLASPIGRGIMVKGIGAADVLIQKALQNVLQRKAYIKTLPKGKTTYNMSGAMGKAMVHGMLEMVQINRGKNLDIRDRWVSDAKAHLEQTKSEINQVSGATLFDYILENMRKMVDITVYNGYGVGLASLLAKVKIDKTLKKWLGVESASDILSQAVSFNVTSEMGFDLMDVADVVRKHPEALAILKNEPAEDFLATLGKVPGGEEAAAAIRGYLDTYGARCTGEIDITRVRWAEKPATLVPMILSNIENFAPGARMETLNRMNAEVDAKKSEWLEQIKKLPRGASKARQTEKRIYVFRNHIGIREYPKYIMMNHYALYKQAMLREADQLVQKGLIQDREDIYYLTFKELQTLVQTEKIDLSLIASRKLDFAICEKMTPPRVITSDGEIITSTYDAKDAPTGALCGIAVSTGVIEGRARVVVRMEDAKLEEGDILVTKFTDPSWTPLFVSIRGLVTEIGGMMTHGAVISREYGLPAVVGVENATQLIQDGQQIRVNGTGGYVEILSE